jgi:hypothetical protein
MDGGGLAACSHAGIDKMAAKISLRYMSLTLLQSDMYNPVRIRFEGRGGIVACYDCPIK